jgi:hypothetical protein
MVSSEEMPSGDRTPPKTQGSNLQIQTITVKREAYRPYFIGFTGAGFTGVIAL